MSPDFEDPRDQPRDGGDGEGENLDVEAQFAQIVANYGDQPAEDISAAERPADPPAETLADRFRVHGWAEPTDPLNTPATWDDEGHFIPPEPPPLGPMDPRRVVAWIGVASAPIAMLVMAVLNWVPPGWLSFLLVCGFIGGFVSLIATMHHDDDQWSGDDGAVL